MQRLDALLVIALVYQAHTKKVLCLDYVAAQVTTQVLPQKLTALVEIVRLVILFCDFKRFVFLLNVRLSPLVQARFESGVVVLRKRTARLLVKLVWGKLLGERSRADF